MKISEKNILKKRGVDKQKLKQALTEALEELTEVRIRDVAHSIGIGHIGSNDVRVVAENLLRYHPDYRFVIMSDHKGQVTSAFLKMAF